MSRSVYPPNLVGGIALTDLIILLLKLKVLNMSDVYKYPPETGVWLWRADTEIWIGERRYDRDSED